MARSLAQEVNLSRRACRTTNQHPIKNNFNNFNNGAKHNKHILRETNLNQMNKKCNLLMEHPFIERDENSVKNSQFTKNINENMKVKRNLSKLNVNYGSIRRSSVVLVLIGILLIFSNSFGAEARPNYTHVDDTTQSTSPQKQTNYIPNDSKERPFAGGIKPSGDLLTGDNEIGVDTNDVGDSDITGHPISDDEHTKPVYFKVSSFEFDRVETPFIISCWILSASIAKIGFHMTPKLNKIFPESCLLIVIGVVVGVILHFATSVHVSPLTPTTFFFYMLPPIILDAGYFMPNRLFFDNIGTILLMAVIGTIFNTGLIGLCLWACGKTGIFAVNIPVLHIFLFSSLISAVDPVAVLAVFEEIHVNEILYIVVFGESLLNDAVTVVLYHMFETYNEMDKIVVTDAIKGVASFFVVALGGTIIGVIWGFMTGLVTRFTDHVRVIEPIFIFIMAYLAYLNAEMFHMSGILSITFCGITMKNYVEANISHKSHTTVKYALKMLSSSAETIIFIFLGVATVNNTHVWNTWFVILTIFFCSVIRTLGVILLTWIANKFRLHKLSNVDKFVISYGGLRGAVAFALVLLIDKKHVPLQPMFVTTTIAVIYFTVFLQGITIRPLVELLKVKKANKRKPTMNERIHEKVIDHLMAGMEDVVGKTGNYNVRDKFKRFDNRFIRPLLIRDNNSTEPKILETYSKLTMRDAMDIMRRNPSTVGQLTNTESMSALFRNYTGVFGGSPSFSNLENCSRNLDMQELDYNPSKKDLTDAKIHHLLAEELKPYRRHRRLSYSRHAVDDRDLSTQVNYRTHMNTRRIMSERKHHKRSKRIHKDGSSKSQNHVSFPEFQQNGSAKQLSNDYINEVLQEGDDDDKIQNQSDEWEGGLTFTAKSTPMTSPPSNGEDNYDDEDDCYPCETNNNNTSLIAHIASLPGFDSSKARLVKHYMSKSNSDKEIVPTAAELILPWRRDRSYQSFGSNDSHPNDSSKRFSKDSEGDDRAATPTATESVLPWKRGDDEDDDGGAVKQNEFPGWASNKEYIAYNSPSATFLGGLSKPKQVRSVIGLFRRESSGSGPGVGGTTDSDSSIQLAGLQTPIHHINGTIDVGGPIVDGNRSGRPSTISLEGNDPLGALAKKGHNAVPFAVTASHRRGNRRGSLLELSGDPIPEENSTKSLPSREKYGMRRVGQQPLLKISTTPRAQIRHDHPQRAALLSASSTETEDDEDFDEGDKPNI